MSTPARRARPRHPSPLRAFLQDQGARSREAARGVRPARALVVVSGVAVAAGVVLIAGVTPLFVQRVLAAASIDEEDIGPFFAAWIVTLLAQAAITFILAIVLAYATAEMFVPRRSVRLRGPRAVIWRSLHRLGNATSITLVLAVAGSAIGITLFGEALETGADSPAELGAIQVGTLFAILTIALLYESVRVVVELLRRLPGLWRWTAALLFPWAAAVLASVLVPFDVTLAAILRQWSQPVEDGAVSTQDGPWLALGLFAVLWIVHFVESGTARHVARALRRSPTDA